MDHTLAKKSSCSIFLKLFPRTAHSFQQEHLRSNSNVAMMLLEPWNSFGVQISLLFPLCFLCFAIGYETGVCFARFPISNHRTNCWRRQPKFLRDVNLPLLDLSPLLPKSNVFAYRQRLLLSPGHAFNLYNRETRRSTPNKWQVTNAIIVEGGITLEWWSFADCPRWWGGGRQLFLELLLYLEDAVRNFHHTNWNISSGRMVHYFG